MIELYIRSRRSPQDDRRTESLAHAPARLRFQLDGAPLESMGAPLEVSVLEGQRLTIEVDELVQVGEELHEPPSRGYARAVEHEGLEKARRGELLRQVAAGQITVEAALELLVASPLVVEATSEEKR